MVGDGGRLIEIFEGCRDGVFVQRFDFQGAFDAGGVVVLSLNDKVVIDTAHFAICQFFIFGKECFYFGAGVVVKGHTVIRGIFFLIDAIEFLQICSGVSAFPASLAKVVLTASSNRGKRFFFMAIPVFWCGVYSA